MTKTGLEFEILVIVICLIFGIWNLEFGVTLVQNSYYDLRTLRALRG